MSKTTDILIIGGGAPGLTLALLLGRIGVEITVIDPAFSGGDADTDTRTSALMKGSLNILRAAGAWPSCEKQAGIMRTLRIVDDSRTGQPPLTVDFTASEIGQDIFGMNIPNAVLHAALLKETGKVKNIVLRRARLSSFEVSDSRVDARLDNGIEINARLIVGADGRRSAVRDIAKIGAWQRDYGQSALTCFISHTKDHGNISTEFHRPGGPFTLVPLPGRMSSVVWVEFKSDADKFLKLNKTAFERALQNRTNDSLGTIALARPPQSWTLQALKARSLTAPRLALIAEAAHVLHPLGAQGLNLSLRDAAALAEILADALRLGLDPGGGAVLERYEKNRRQDIESRVRGTHAMNHIVSTSSPLLRHIRRTGLRTLDTLGPLKHLVMREGLAPAREGSRLAQGKPL